MSNPFVAEIRIFAGNFAPTGLGAVRRPAAAHLPEHGAVSPCSEPPTAGTGQSNFALPNLQAAPRSRPAQGPGLSLRDLGETGGEQTVTLLQTEMPAHSHQPVSRTAPQRET